LVYISSDRALGRGKRSHRAWISCAGRASAIRTLVKLFAHDSIIVVLMRQNLSVAASGTKGDSFVCCTKVRHCKFILRIDFPRDAIVLRKLTGIK
jgi:hypothetical protein